MLNFIVANEIDEEEMEAVDEEEFEVALFDRPVLLKDDRVVDQDEYDIEFNRLADALDVDRKLIRSFSNGKKLKIYGLAM